MYYLVSHCGINSGCPENVTTFLAQSFDKISFNDQNIWLSKSAIFLITVDKMGKKSDHHFTELLKLKRAKNIHFFGTQALPNRDIHSLFCYSIIVFLIQLQIRYHETQPSDKCLSNISGYHNEREPPNGIYRSEREPPNGIYRNEREPPIGISQTRHLPITGLIMMA